MERIETERRAHILQMGSQSTRDQLTQQRSQALFNGQTEVGHTDHVIVYSDGTPQGDATAQAILQTVEADYLATTDWFGGIALPPGQEGDDQTVPRTATPVQVLMDAQAGGAYHFGCNATDIYVEPTPELGNGFFVAELVEVFESAINNGWDCGQTNGEGLSRVLAGERNPNLGPLFVQTEQSWWANGHADYISDNSADDTNQDANGCATLFLYYLHTQLGYDWRTIVAAGAGTLAGTYQRLTGQDGASGFNDFLSRLASLDMGGFLAVPANGNPFPLGAAGAPAQQPSGGQGEPVPVPSGAMGGASSGYGSAYDPAMPYGGLAGDQGAAGGDGGVDVIARHVEVYEAVPGESGQRAQDAAAAAGQPVYKVYETEVETLYPPNSDAAIGGGDQTQPNLRVQRPATSSAGAGAPAGALADRDALDRTGRIEPRGLDTSPAPYIQAPATTPRGDGMEAMIFVLVVLIVLVLLALLTVLFASGIIHIG